MSYYHQESWLPMMRSITKEKFFCDPYCVQLYLYFYLSAKRHEDMFGRDPLLRGQMETTQSEITEFLKIPRQILRSRMQKLEEQGYITVRCQQRRCTVITVRMFDNLLGVVRTNQGGWVKLYDEIKGSLFFMNAKAVVVYVTLLSLQRSGEPMTISMRNFAMECQLSIRDVIAGMKKLQREDIINCDFKSGHGKMLVSFKNRGLALPPDDDFEALESPKIQPRNNQGSTKTLPNINQGSTKEIIEEAEFENYIVTDCKTNAYGFCQPSDNQVKTKEEPTSIPATPAETTTKCALARDTYQLENREREEKESERERISPALSEEKSKDFSEENSAHDMESSYADKLKRNGTWLALMCRKFGYSDVKVIYDKLDDFLLDTACLGKQHRSLQDFQSHFVSCLKLNINHQSRVYTRTQNFAKNGNTEQRTAAWANRRGTEPSATCAQDYVASFSAFNA